MYGDSMSRNEVCIHSVSEFEIAKVSERKTKEKYSSYVMVIPMPIARAIGLRNGDALKCMAIEIEGSAKKGFLCVRLE
jgi:hypothetical protein